MSDFTTDMKINPNKLHLEWVRQPELYAKWGEWHVKAIYEKDQLKLKQDVLRAQLDTKIRTHWQSLGLAKAPTEAGVDSFIMQNIDFRKLAEEINIKTYQINMFNAARQGLEHKKRALEGLERLHIAGYYATITASLEGADEQLAYMADAQTDKLSQNSRLLKKRLATTKE